MSLPGGILEVGMCANMLHGIYSVCAVVEVFVRLLKINNSTLFLCDICPLFYCSYR